MELTWRETRQQLRAALVIQMVGALQPLPAADRRWRRALLRPLTALPTKTQLSHRQQRCRNCPPVDQVLLEGITLGNTHRISVRLCAGGRQAILLRVVICLCSPAFK